MAVLKFAPDASDREMALGRLLQGQPPDEIILAVTEALKADRNEYPVFRSTARLGELKLERLRSFFRDELRHASFGRRTEAVTALGRLGPTAMDTAGLRGLINDQEPYAVIRAALLVLKDWDATANRDIFERAIGLASPHHAIKALAYDVLQRPEGVDRDSVTTASLRKFLDDVAAGVKDSPRMAPGVSDEAVPRRTATVAGWMKDLKSFSLLAADEPAGSAGRRVWYYKLTTGVKTIYTTFVVLPDGRVADFDFTRD
jgi:hypothetical protein